jgi:hypothetical protein
MVDAQEQSDDAMFDFSAGNYDGGMTKLQSLLTQEPTKPKRKITAGWIEICV